MREVCQYQVCVCVGFLPLKQHCQDTPVLESEEMGTTAVDCIGLRAERLVELSASQTRIPGAPATNTRPTVGGCVSGGMGTLVELHPAPQRPSSFYQREESPSAPGGRFGEP